MFFCVLLSPPTQEENYHLTKPGAIHPISRSPIDPKFYHSAINRLAISEVTKGESVQTNPNLRTCLLVLQVLQPFSERLLAFGALVVANFNHGHCNL